MKFAVGLLLPVRSITLEAEALTERHLILPWFTPRMIVVEVLPEFAVAVNDIEDE